MKLAIVGTQGIPNTYGGFETLAEYLVRDLSSKLEITVYCSSKDKKGELPTSYKGATLKYIPVSSHGLNGIIYDSIALLDAIKTNDKVLFLGFGGGGIIPFLGTQKRKLILNFGGLDWKRRKWGIFARKIIKLFERNLVKNSSVVIADNVGILNYIVKEYNINPQIIAYGGDQAKHRIITDKTTSIYPFLKKSYAFTVTRIQADNNIDMIIDAFSKDIDLPLAIVGNWEASSYGQKLKEKYSNHKNLILLDAIYDREILDVLRSNCKIYIHAHSAGGTNPSLCEAMYLGLPILAFSSGYNEYTTQNKARYFNNATNLRFLVNSISDSELSEIGLQLKSLAYEKYKWEEITSAYYKLFIQ